MIEINEMRLPITPEQGRNILQMQTDTFGSFFDLDRILEHESFYLMNIYRNVREWRKLANDPSLGITKRNDIIRVLTNRFGVSEYKLNGLNKDVVAALTNDPTLSPDVQEFLRLYKQLNEWQYMVSYLGQYKSLPLSQVETFDNHRMVVAKPLWNLLSTSRISASDPSLQNVSKNVSDIYTAPKGYALVFSDSGQIEPRITYSKYIRDDLIVRLITEYNDAYYGLLHFIQCSEYEEAGLRSDTIELKLHEITKETAEARQVLKVLGLAGNYGSSNLSSIHPVFGPLYEEKIVKHPARLEWEKRVRAEVRNGVETFYGAFGTPVTPDETTTYTKGGNGWSEHVVRCGINNPIQTTASELMFFSINESAKVLGTEGFINYYKHDEGSFYVPEDKVDIMAPKLRECMSYAVKDWIPIGSDLHIGRKGSKNDTCLFG